jgi:hypothetical protein
MNTRRSFLVGVAATAAGAISGCGGDQSDAFIEFRSGANLRSCAVGAIRLIIDGSERGTMNAGESRTFPVSPGSHSVEARDLTGSWGPQTFSPRAGETATFTLNC